jgi:hypothetical protein
VGIILCGHIVPLFEAECHVYNEELRDLYSSPCN